MNKIQTIIRKEWAEIFKNRMVIFTVGFLPLMMTALPLIILYATRSESLGGTSTELPEQFTALCPPALSGGECFQVYMVSQFMLMFMILPLAIPVTISAYSIVGEKISRSLEPLLATPITTAELLAGKGLAAGIPAVAATYLAFLVYALGAWFLMPNKTLYLAMLDARWIVAILLVGPLMALFSITVSVIVSSRVNDPRVAEQIAMVVILPLMAVFFAQIAGVILINLQFVLWAALALAIVNLATGALAVRLFQRETILTRWK